VDRQRGTTWSEVRALLRRLPHHYLIAKPRDDPDTPWEFPGGRIHLHEPPESALHRLCQQQLGVSPLSFIAQQPFVHSFGTRTVTYRYYVCPVTGDDVVPLEYELVRWVSTAELREYVFDPATQQVVDRIIATDHDR
jgi:8-oxo-dGTP diphosphatase